MRDQSWFTVIVELVLIVAGVFLGMQVSNWNEARNERQQEVVILGRLAADFRDIESSLLENLSKTARNIEVLHQLSQQVGQIGGSEDITTDMRLLIEATNTVSIIGGSPTYEELLSNGNFGLLQSALLRNALGAYAQTNKFTDFVHRTIWDATLQFSPQILKINTVAFASMNAPDGGRLFKRKLDELFQYDDLVVEIGSFIATQKYMYLRDNENLTAARAVLKELGQEPNGRTQTQLIDDIFGAN